MEKVLLVEHGNSDGGLFGLIGKSPLMRRVFEQVRRLGPTHCTVLISGESGTGKKRLAQALHELSPSATGPLVYFNAAVVPREEAERMLLGQAHGLNGAASHGDVQRGKFAEAHQGTLVIDEVAELDLPLQAKLLRAIEARAIRPVGAEMDQEVDVRLVVLTCRDLRALAASGQFRTDLCQRLQTVRIDVPPLRQRPEDLPLLAAIYLEQLREECCRRELNLSAAAMESLQTQSWPGNVRQLRNALERAVLTCSRETIEPGDLSVGGHKVEEKEDSPRFRLGMKLEELEREVIQHCLLHTSGSRQRTAQLLGISTRTLLRKIHEYELQDPLRRSKLARLV